MPQVCFSADRVLIKQLDQLAKAWNMARSRVIKLILKDSVPVLIGKKPLKEAVEPTLLELLEMIQLLEGRIERLERKKEDS